MNKKTKTPSPRSTIKGKKNPKRKTTFSCAAPDATWVFVAGTFNDWKADEIPLKQGKAGRWSVVLNLKPGHHEFKFIVDGQWCCKTDCEDVHHDCLDCVPNEHGTMNRVVEVE